MTLSASVDVSDSRDEARGRLQRTARTLVLSWVAAFGLRLLLLVLAGAALAVALTQQPVFVVTWSALLVAAGWYVARGWPPRCRRDGVRLDRDEFVALRLLVDPDDEVAWPAVVRLSPRADVLVRDGELELGLPLLAGLDRAELHGLLRIAAEAGALEQTATLRWALRVAHDDRRRTERLVERAAALEVDLENWVYACEREALASDLEATHLLAVREQVREGWELVQAEWLDPAVERGRRHVAPFTGLRRFLQHADVAGWLAVPGPCGPLHEVVAGVLARHEETVAAELTPGRTERLRPITWAEHPAQVTVPHWRALVAEVLDAARRATRDHEHPTLDTLLTLLASGAVADLAEATATDRGIDVSRAEDPAYAEWSSKFVPRVLAAGIGIAAADAHRFEPVFAWPAGTSLQAADGWALPVEAITLEVMAMVRGGAGLESAYGELRTALVELGVALHEPLWLDHASNPYPEQPIASFTALQGVSTRLVVVTDRALHVFRDPQGARLDRLVRRADVREDASDPLRRRMLTVWQGDTTDEVAAVPATRVRRARFGPAVGGLWWRLVVEDGGAGLVLRGRGDGTDTEHELRRWLGDRLETSWLRVPRRRLATRNRISRIGPVLAVLDLRRGRPPAAQRASSPTGTSAASVLPGPGSGQAQAASYAQEGA